MKNKFIKALVLFLAVALLLPACSDGESEVTTISLTTTGPVTVGETEVVTVPNTENITHPDPDEFLVLRDSKASDHLVGDGKDALLANDHGIKITEKNDGDIVKTVKGAVQAGRSDEYGALLLTSKSAVELLCEGFLQDLSEAGIDADKHLPSGDISRTLAFGGGIYMICSDALSSKYSSANAVLYRADTLDAELAKLVLDGNFTLEAAMTMAESAGSSMSASVDAKGVSLMYQGMGGKLFTASNSGLPTVSLSGKDDAAAYGALLGKTATMTAQGGMFAVAKLANAKDGEFYLPMPKASTEQANYITPIETDEMSVLALPYGVSSGAPFERTLAALTAVSADTPAKMAKSLSPNGGDARLIAEKIVNSLSIDQASLYDLGDIDMSGYLFENLVSQVEFDTVVADKRLASIRKAVDVAMSIINGRIENRRTK